MLNIFKIIVLIAFIPSASILFANVQEKSESVTLFGNSFNAKPYQLGGTSITWSKVKTNIIEVLPNYQKINMAKKASKKYIINLSKKAAYRYRKSIQSLTNKLASYDKVDNLDFFELEIAGYLSVGHFGLLIEKYKSFDKSIAAEIKIAQKIHDDYVFLLYIEDIVKR
ncbi:MAG: hypothetical protein COB02_05435 [Candidatus Cloacimonadota bacterium]|nr:MAG: hypothetical protein COB02_05435 [Candidatus Cloacimonadota bacterium]